MSLETTPAELAEKLIRTTEGLLAADFPLRSRVTALRELVRWASNELVDDGKYLGACEELRRKARGNCHHAGLARQPSGQSKLVLHGQNETVQRYRKRLREVPS
jgi:hypothetical protein